jgi:hypothetical protein
MQLTLTLKQTDDPHDFVVVPPDVVRVAPADEELTHLVQDLARRHSHPQIQTEPDFAAAPAAPVPPVDATFRPTAVNDVASGRRGTIGRLAGRTFTALLLAGCTGVAALAWQSYGDTAKAMIGEWTPGSVLTSLPLEKLGLSASSPPPAAEATAVSAAPPQAATLAPGAPEAVATTAVAVPADSAPSLESMARDLASARQEIVQLKASVAELKAGQQQISRDAAAKAAFEQNARARMAALPPRPAIARPRKPPPAFPPQQTFPSAQAATAPQLPQAAAPPAPRQVDPLPPAAAPPPADPALSSVPRPPMPVR